MMRKSVIGSLLVALFAAFYPVSLSAFQAADAAKGRIDGTATDALNKPLAGDVVRLLTPKGKEVGKTTTSATGGFSFLNVDPGKDYVVQIKKDDQVVGIAGNLEVKPGVVTPAIVTGTNELGKVAPKGGFNFTRFVIFTGLITVAASVFVAKRKK